MPSHFCVAENFGGINFCQCCKGCDILIAIINTRQKISVIKWEQAYTLLLQQDISYGANYAFFADRLGIEPRNFKWAKENVMSYYI